MGFRYIGSKIKILDKVLSKIEIIAPNGGHVVDLMCGTASVSLALRKKGYRVSAIDVMTYSYHHARVALLLSAPPNYVGAKDFIKEYYRNTEPSLYPISYSINFLCVLR
ncbi:DNA adenine methylase [Thermodesulfobacteriota bacterium]